MVILRHLTIKELCRLILHNQNPQFDYKEAAEQLALKAGQSHNDYVRSLNQRIGELEQELLNQTK